MHTYSLLKSRFESGYRIRATRVSDAIGNKTIQKLRILSGPCFICMTKFRSHDTFSFFRSYSSDAIRSSNQRPKLRVIGKRFCNRALPHFDANSVWLFQSPLDRVIAVPPDALFLTEDVHRKL